MRRQIPRNNWKHAVLGILIMVGIAVVVGGVLVLTASPDPTRPGNLSSALWWWVVAFGIGIATILVQLVKAIIVWRWPPPPSK